MSINRQKYRDLCAVESMPIFQEAFWLDATAGSEGWNAAVVEKGGQIIGALPFTVVKRFRQLTYLGQPSLTQHLGPWIRPTNAKYANQLSREKDIMQELIAQLPPYSRFAQNWSYRYQNWLPFYWAGFEQTTNYTYVLDELTNLDQVFSDFQEKVRTDIRKAESRFLLNVRTDHSLDTFLELNRMVFERQSMTAANSDSFVRNLVDVLVSKQRVKWFVAEDAEKRCHAGVLVVWDDYSAYYLMGGGDPELRNSGATSLCMWEAIKFSASVAKSFDFEGSMIEPIERFVRGFGARQKPYFSVSNTPSRALRLARAFKALR